MKTYDQRQQPSILPALPQLEGVTPTYCGRDLPEHHLDRQGHSTAKYLVPGVFPAESPSHTSAQLLKAQIITFDLDFVDIACHHPRDEMMAKARAGLTDKGITTVWNKKKEIDINTEDAGEQRYVIKAWIASLPIATLMKQAAQRAEETVKFLDGFIGCRPSHINYSGTGIHIHYTIAETEGWTENGVKYIPGGVDSDAEDAMCNIGIFRRAYMEIEKQYVAHFGYELDDKCKDIGTRLTRDLGVHNYKHSGNVKTVTAICSELCGTERLTQAMLTERCFPAPKVKGTRSSTAQAIIDAKGNTYDGRKSRTPATVDAEQTFTFLHPSDGEVTLEVAKLKEHWQELVDDGCMIQDSFGLKLKGRMDWVSEGSLNAWVRFDEKNDELIFRTQSKSALNANDAHVFVEGGSLTGIWVYRNAVAHILRRNAKGTLLGGIHNVQVILMLAPETANKIRKNSRLKNIEVHRDIAIAARPADPILLADKTEWHQMNEDVLNYLLAVVETYYEGKTCQIDLLHRAIQMVATKSSYDDVTSWVENIVWDGKRRLDGEGAWLPAVMGLTKDHPRFDLYATYGRAAMLATVRNVYHNQKDPVASQHMLLLKGGQGAGKSTLAKIMAATKYVGHEYFGDEEIKVDGKAADQIQLLVGKILMEIPELAAFNKKDYAAIKSFLTRGRIEGRLAYARTTTKMWVSTYFVGTTNSLCPLGDPSGNRRFMVVDMHKDLETADGRLDLPALNAMIPQLYAEAYQRVVLGANIPADRQACTVNYAGALVEDWNLSQPEVRVQERHNLTFTAADQVLDAIHAYLDEQVAQGRFQLPMEKFQKVLKEEYEITRVNNRTLSEALLDHGWVQKRLMSDGRRQRLWVYQGEQQAQADQTRLPGERLTEPAPAPAPAEPSNSEIMAQLQALMAKLEEKDAIIEEQAKKIEELTNGPKGPGPKGGSPKPKKNAKSAPKTSAIRLSPVENADEVVEILSQDDVQAYLETSCTTEQYTTLNNYRDIYSEEPTPMGRMLKGTPLVMLYNNIIAAN